MSLIVPAPAPSAPRSALAPGPSAGRGRCRGTAWLAAALLAVVVAAPPPVLAAPTRPTAPPPAGADAPETILARAKQAYARGDYEVTVGLVRPLLYPAVQVASEDEVLAHTLLALSYFFLRDLPQSEQEFSTLLQLDAAFRLDPVVDPPKAITFLEEIRRRNQQKLDEIAEQRRQERADEERRRRAEEEARLRQVQKPVVVERVIRRNSRLISLLPFGIGQFQNGDRGRGYALLATQVVFGAASLALYAAVRLRWADGRYAASERVQALTLSYLSVGLGAAFWIDVIAGVVDALLRFRPLIVEHETTIQPPPPKKLGLAPFLSPGATGLSLEGAF